MNMHFRVANGDMRQDSRRHEAMNEQGDILFERIGTGDHMGIEAVVDDLKSHRIWTWQGFRPAPTSTASIVALTSEAMGIIQEWFKSGQIQAPRVLLCAEAAQKVMARLNLTEPDFMTMARSWIDV